jgi:hypothetical protein
LTCAHSPRVTPSHKLSRQNKLPLSPPQQQQQQQQQQRQQQQQQQQHQQQHQQVIIIKPNALTSW